ncbi:HAD family hydrolase [Gemella cuniculi]|uniref:HAD family hydrolase n=1 Tax=Gemella cuniculi TaxID=150240 RepID=UPI000422C67A|nr:HAD family hydrolase [Gemella cuniculi]
MSKIKNLIFDLDNTLYDFSTVWKKSNELTFNYFNYNEKTTYKKFFQTYKKINNMLVQKINAGELRLIHLRNERLILTLREYNIILNNEDCEKYYKKQFEFIIELIVPDKKLIEKLKILKKDYNLVILTNGKSYEQRMKIKKLGLENLFKLYISEETYLSKPKLEAFKNVLEKNNFEEAETIMVGDSIFHDIQPAERLGLKTCLIDVQWHFDDEKKQYTGCKVRSIKEFIEKIESIII